MSYAVLLYGMAKRDVRTMFRYGFDMVTQLFSLVVLFALLFYGAKAVMGGHQTGNTLSSIVAGYFVWMVSVFSYGSTAQSLLQEATEGTLEQLAMSPFGLRAVIAMQFFSGLLVQFSMLVGMLFVMMAISGRWLHIDVLSLIPLLIFTVAGIFGVGLITGGAALVFKRIAALMQLLQFGFVAVVAAPIDKLPWFKYLPVAWGNLLIRRVLVDGTPITHMAAGDLLFLVVHGTAWLTLGLLVLGRFERIARERALLGHY